MGFIDGLYLRNANKQQKKRKQTQVTKNVFTEVFTVKWINTLPSPRNKLFLIKMYTCSSSHNQYSK